MYIVEYCCIALITTIFHFEKSSSNGFQGCSFCPHSALNNMIVTNFQISFTVFQVQTHLNAVSYGDGMTNGDGITNGDGMTTGDGIQRTQEPVEETSPITPAPIEFRTATATTTNEFSLRKYQPNSYSMRVCKDTLLQIWQFLTGLICKILSNRDIFPGTSI